MKRRARIADAAGARRVARRGCDQAVGPDPADHAETSTAGLLRQVERLNPQRGIAAAYGFAHRPRGFELPKPRAQLVHRKATDRLGDDVIALALRKVHARSSPNARRRLPGGSFLGSKLERAVTCRNRIHRYSFHFYIYGSGQTSDFGVLACGQKAADGASHRCNAFIEMPFKTLDRPAEGNRESAGEWCPWQQQGNT